ncbi:ATP-dependent helicase [Peptoniphilus sp. KCTC 25270]|uniref:ATP-dependent helicase n=1 Tax=Peptoniphilus sp. KCTC 25270 TaxID=2897414 RepID=UPI001E4FEFD8|nr:ATP-dependent helicase [Peptoniphilus sp. KCTC 25270]MCD1146617.1 ATP-dependent helicase [Peptoniphilus sp. KCTC 25270]
MNLTKEQELAIAHKDGPALVLAVPGSGKTTMLLWRTKQLLEQGIHPSRILTITFSRTAAKDIQKRFEQLFPEMRQRPVFSTIHSFCYSIIRSYERKTGRQYTLIEGGKGPSKYQILKDIYKSVNHTLPNEDQLEAMVREIGMVKNKSISPESYGQSRDCQTTQFYAIYFQYEKLKKEKLWIDFDDMITLSISILQKDASLLRSVRKAYDYIQVDEGQDTSFQQMRIIQSIAKPHNNLFIVADDDQSIYGFRGADYKALFRLKTIYPDLKSFYLSINFRSTPEIVSTCRRFIEQNEERFQKDIQTFHEKGIEPKFFRLNDLKAQYEFILREMAKEDLGEVAVLYRNNISALGLIETLEQREISFRCRDTKNTLTHHWVLKDLLMILEFAQDPTRLDLYERFYYKINGYVSKKNIEYAKKHAKGNSVIDTMARDDIPPYLQKNLRELRENFRHLKTLPLNQAFRFIEYDLNYRTYITKHAKTFGSSEHASLRILFYMKHIAKHAKDKETFMGRILYLDQLLKGGYIDNENLFLSTFHGAKGLEFDTVFLIDLIEDIIPSPMALTRADGKDFEELEEERRLFYVAMSRARKNLYLISPKTVNHLLTKPSVFYEQIEEWHKKNPS